jgi:hypothetical protein
MTNTTRLVAKVTNTTRLVAKVTNNSGRLSAQSPIALKNQIQEIRSIEDIADVTETNVVEGATLVYNSTLDKYEVKLLDVTNQIDNADLDGGTF